MKNNAFSENPEVDVQEILAHLKNSGMLEQVGRELIIGVDGELIVNDRNFYSVFQTEERFKVIHSGNSIGEVPFSLQIREGENLLLAAKVWKIRFVEDKTKKIEVGRQPTGKDRFFSEVAQRFIREFARKCCKSYFPQFFPRN